MLIRAIERHIALQKTLGFLYCTQSGQLRLFGRFAKHRGDSFVRASTAIEWARQGRSVGTRHRRLELVRRLARLLRPEDKRHEVPAGGAFGRAPPRRVPYIFTDAEIRALLDAADALGPRGSLRPKTYATLFGLISATGLRISEALGLRLPDVTAAGLIIRATKFKKTRLVPLHDSVQKALDAYLRARSRSAADDSVFISVRGTRLRYETAISTFLALARTIGIRPGRGKPGCRIHDLRHTFAVRCLEKSTGSRDAVARHMLALGTYLGHAHVHDTYWYLQATPLLLAKIAKQSEAHARGGAQ